MRPSKELMKILSEMKYVNEFTDCEECPMSSSNNGTGVNCIDYFNEVFAKFLPRSIPRPRSFDLFNCDDIRCFSDIIYKTKSKVRATKI
jgi:hypothetical protein